MARRYRAPRFQLLETRAGRTLALPVLAIAVLTACGLALLWPSGDAGESVRGGLSAKTERAEVTAIELSACPPPQTGECGSAEISVETGPDAGEAATIPLGSALLGPDLSVGDAIRVARNEAPAPPGVAAPGAAATYAFADFERGKPMLWLALIFAALVIVFARLRGALSLLGLVASLGVVVGFIAPAILEGRPPLATAVVGALAVMLLTIPLAHGINVKSLAAMLGTTASLLGVAALAVAFTQLTNLTGLSSEEVALLQLDGAEVDFRGLLVAGMVIGALGVLDDVTVSQASTVMALRAANPELTCRELYGRAVAVGRDHVSATVNTLVLAYVGASLPALLIFSTGSAGVIQTLNVELVSKEVVATLVGSIGLIAAVPITTAVCAAFAFRPSGASRHPAG